MIIRGFDIGVRLPSYVAAGMEWPISEEPGPK